MGEAIGMALLGLHAAAVIDAWASRLSRTARGLWTLTLVFLPVVGLVCWGLTRATAYHPAPAEPGSPEAGPAGTSSTGT